MVFPLNYAFDRGFERAAQILIDTQKQDDDGLPFVDVNQKSNDGILNRSPLDISQHMFSFRPKLFFMLLETLKNENLAKRVNLNRNLSYNTENQSLIKSILQAGYTGRYVMAKILLSLKDTNGQNVVSMDKEDYLECTKFIRLTGRTDLVEIALARAPEHFKKDIASMAIESSCRINSIRSGKFLRKLLNDFPDIDVNQTISKKYMTPLAFACQVGHVEAVKVLLQHGNSKINSFVRNSITSRAPLFEACKFGQLEVVKVLLETLNEDQIENRVDLYATNEDCENAFDVAKKFGRKSIMEELMKVMKY